MVNRVTVTFESPAVLDSGAIELRGANGTPVDLRLDISVAGGKTVAVLTFAGPGVTGGSLADGTYTLTVRADRVHDRWGRELDRDADGAAGGDRVNGFHRLFGDGDGDRWDKTRFRSHAGDSRYLWYFDFDGNGDVDGRDKREFNRRFGRP
jgi:hypothetical protein